MIATEAMQRLELTDPTLESGGDRPLPLRGDRVWLVHSGRVDVFAVSRRGDAVTGGRAHLFRVEEGGMVPGMGDASAAGIEVLGVGSPGTRLIELDRARLQMLAAEPKHAAAVCALIEQWVDILCRSMLRGAPPGDSVAVPAGAEAAPVSSRHVRPGGAVGWVRHLEGHSLLFGRDGLKVNGTGWFPLSERTWIEVEAGSRLRMESTVTLIEQGSMWAGLDGLHALLLQAAAQDAEAASAAERERLRRRAHANAAALRSAFGALADTLNPTDRVSAAAETPAPATAYTLADPFFDACARVAAATQIRIAPLPRSAHAAPIRDPLAALARANRFRTRQVVLREGWWHEDGGPMLGTLSEGGQPVALLPVRGRRYRLYDPREQSEMEVTPEVAERIAPLAHAFYRPFPDRPLGVSDILRFGLHGCRSDLAMVIAMGIAGGLLSLMTPIATGMIFNDIIPGAARSQLLQLTVILLVIAVTSALFTITSGIALVRVESRMGSAVQAGVWDRLLSLPTSFFQPYAAGNLATRAMGIDAIRRMLSGATITAVLGGLFSVFHFGLLFHYSARLAAWAALLIGVAIVVTLVVGRLQTRWERLVAGAHNRLAGYVLQFLGSIAKLRVAAAETQAFALWARQFGHQRQFQFRARSLESILGAFQVAFPLVATLVLYALAMPLLSAGALRTGDFLAFMTAFGSCLAGLLSACAALIGAVQAIPLYEQAKPILRARPEVDTARTDPGILAGDVEMQHISFRYGAEGPLVLRDVGIRIRSGEYVAFVGPSGSGKSTLLRLLLGFETPESGAIFYDGQELSGLDIQAVRRQIGVVLQNGRLMAGDIFTNIVGSATATLDEAWEAAAMAGFDEDIKRMPMGMHTIISEGGGTLSGGQRQRLTIARAIVQKPRILLFDEATSALDNRTQAIVSASLDRLQATRVVIAHRLSTIASADRIYVIQAGRVVQHGTHEQLMEADGLFAELARRQLA